MISAIWNKGSTRTSFLRHQPRSHLQGKSPGNEVVPTLQTAPLPPTHPRARVILVALENFISSVYFIYGKLNCHDLALKKSLHQHLA